MNSGHGFYRPGDSSILSNSTVRENPLNRSLSPLQVKLGLDRIGTLQRSVGEPSNFGYNNSNINVPPGSLRLNTSPFKGSSIIETPQSVATPHQGQRVAPASFKFKDISETSSIFSKQHSQSESIKQSRYSPLRRPYDESRSPSVISHLNTTINEQLRAAVDSDRLIASFADSFASVVAANAEKLQAFLDNLQSRLAKMKTESQREVVERMELEKLNEDQRFFEKKTKMASRWTAAVRSKLEDREMIFRALHKMAAARRSPVDYLDKKAAEIEAENARERESGARRLEIMNKEVRESENVIQELDRVLKSKENEWVIRDHQHTVALELEARNEMNRQSYEIVMKYFRANQHNPEFVKPTQQIAELLRIRDYYENQLQEAKLYANEQELRKEITRLERLKASRDSASRMGYFYKHRD